MNQKLKRYLGITGTIVSGMTVIFVSEKLLGHNPSAASDIIYAVINIPIVLYANYREDKKKEMMAKRAA